MKKYLAAALALAMALGLTACSKPAPAAPTPATSTPASAPTITYGTSADYPPFEFHILDNGQDKIVGIDVFLAEQIAADMGAQLQIVDMNFDNLLVLMGQGKCDFVIAAMEATPEREEAASCSDPYYTDLPPMIVVKKGNEGSYAALTDFAGKKVGAQSGTTKADIVNNDMTGANPVLLTTVGDLINQLAYDKLDAVVLDGAVAQKYVQSNPDLAVVEAISLGEALEPYRVWVAKGDPKGLLESINKTIAAVTADDTFTGYIEKANELSSQAMGG